MRLLPCRSKQCVAAGAMLRPSRACPKGEPALSGQYVSEYKCYRCGEVNKLSAGEYNSLSKLTIRDFDKISQEYGSKWVRNLATADLEGLGFKRAHAEDLHNAGIQTAHDVEGLSK
jgi:hypothetical protein